MTDHHHGPHHHQDGEPDWDAVYNDEDRIWSGNPNSTLVALAADLPVGRGVDVGCGEGADSIWLATRGWTVSGLDPSGVALDRARAAAARLDADVDWVHAGLADAGLPPESFDLVSVFYPALPKKGSEAVAAVVGLVAPGGTLVMVAHADVDRAVALEHGFDPDDYIGVDDVVAALHDGWKVDVHTRDRDISEGRGAHHRIDTVLVATRAPLQA